MAYVPIYKTVGREIFKRAYLCDLNLLSEEDMQKRAGFLKIAILTVISASLLIGCSKTAEVKDSKPMTPDEAAVVKVVEDALKLYETAEWQKLVDTYYTKDAIMTRKGVKYDPASWVATAGNPWKTTGKYKITKYSVDGDTAKVVTKWNRYGTETFHLVRQNGAWKIYKETNP